MSDRLQISFLVQALVRRTAEEGGFAAVLQKGDVTSGALLLACIGSDRQIRLYERMPDFSGGYHLGPVAEKNWGDEAEINAYIDRRKQSDPDLWVVELDIPNGEQLADRLFGSD